MEEKDELIEKLISRLIKKIPKLPYAKEVEDHFKKVLILTIEQPPMGREALDSFQEYFNNLASIYLGEKVLLSKNQYIAIVGDSFIDEKMIINLCSDFGIKKKNIRFCLDYGKYKNGHYSDLLYSSQCVAIILGPVPHSSKDNQEKALSEKIFLATDQSKKLKLTKDSLIRALVNMKSFLNKK